MTTPLGQRVRLSGSEDDIRTVSISRLDGGDVIEKGSIEKAFPEFAGGEYLLRRSGGSALQLSKSKRRNDHLHEHVYEAVPTEIIEVVSCPAPAKPHLPSVSLEEFQSELSNLEASTTIDKDQLDNMDKEIAAKMTEAGLTYLSLQESRKLNRDSELLEDKTRAMEHGDHSLMAKIQILANEIYQQRLELHEYTAPRLFIILLKPIGQWDALQTPFWHRFQLFFLCEGCGSAKGGRTGLHETHLVKHRGYDVTNATEFIEKYGSYVLTLLRIIKYGAQVDDMVISPLAGFHSLETLTDVRIDLDLAGNTPDFLIDRTIRFLKEQLNQTDGYLDMELPELLRGADLTQLAGFLDNQEGTDRFGGLHRIVTPEADGIRVKWVCGECLGRNRTADEQKKLGNVVNHVRIRKGEFDQYLSRVEINLANKDASKFYDSLANTQLLELSIRFDWDAKQEDLQSFAAAILGSNILHLTIDAQMIGRRMGGVVYLMHRYNPILDLLTRGKIRSLELIRFIDFYRRMEEGSLKEIPHLRDLSVESEVKEESFSKFMQYCPNLMVLTVKCNELASVHTVLGYFEKNLFLFRDLETITVDSPDLTVTVNIYDGEMTSVTGTLRNIHELIEDHCRLYSTWFTKFTVHCSSTTKGNIARNIKNIESFMNPNPSSRLRSGSVQEETSRLEELVIVAELLYYHIVLDHITETRWSSTSLSRIILHNEGTGLPEDSITMTVEKGPEITTDIIMSSRPPPQDQSMHTSQIQSALLYPQPPPTPLRNTQPPIQSRQQTSVRAGVLDLKKILEKYGKTIRRLETNDHFEDEHLSILSKAITRGGSKLTHLVLDTTGLSNDDAISAIMKKSKVESLHLKLHGLGRWDVRKLGIYLLLNFAHLITELTVGAGAVVGLDNGYSAPMELPYLRRLKTFRMTWPRRQALSDVHARLTRDIVLPQVGDGEEQRGIPATMHSASPPCGDGGKSVKSTKSAKSSKSAANTASTTTTTTTTNTHGPFEGVGSEPAMQSSASLPSRNSLKTVYLENVSFEPNNWNQILNALDLTTLESLSFKGTNFDGPQLELLLERISSSSDTANNSPMPFTYLQLESSDLVLREEGNLPVASEHVQEESGEE